MANYELQWAKQAWPFLKYSNLANLLIIAIKIASSRDKDKSTLIIWFLTFGCYTLSLAIATAAVKIKLELMRYVSAFGVIVRISFTFLLLHLVSSGESGFDKVDIKELSSAIPFVAMPMIFIGFLNWTLNLVVTAPAALISCYVAIKLSHTTLDDNMACFTDPEEFTSGFATGWLINLWVPLVIAYWIRLITLERFIDHHNSLKQQD